MDFRLLGPLEVWDRGRPLALGGTKQRALLAILLLHANEVVSRDLLMDELWGARPPRGAPHTLETYVSRLRKTLHADREGEPVVVTRPPGYMLRVGFGELDLHHFERLLEEGRRALATHAPERAAAKLHEALALWRGRALADVEFEDFARVEIDRLDELRLQALEERIEAELALGRHESLVPELESLAAQHPLRERLRGQLMLALYRSGRQAEALQVYRESRGYLVEELGIEPGPGLRAMERAILRQDEVLVLPDSGDVATATPPGDSPPAREPVSVAGAGGASRRRPRMPFFILAAAGAAVVVAATVAVPLVLLGSDQGGETGAVEGDALVLVGRNGKLGATVPLGTSPTQVAAGFGSLWATSSDGQTVAQIDPERHVVRDTIRVGSGPSGIAVGSGAVWVANALSGTISRIDPGTGDVVQTIPLGARPSDLAAGNASVWAAIPSSKSLVQLDGNTGQTVKTIHLEAAPTALTFGSGALWVASEQGRTVFRVDAGTDAVTQVVSVGGGPSAVAYGAGAVWVANSLDGTISRVDPVRGAVEATIRVGNGPDAVTATRAGIWVSDRLDGSAALIDPGRNAVVRRVRTGGSPTAVAASGASAWIAVRAQGPTHRGGTLVMTSSEPSLETLDPRFLTSLQPTQLRGMTNDGLVTFEHVGGSGGVQLVPDLAVSLPPATGAEKSYAFSLRPGIRYSTGRLVRASDVRSSIEHLFEGGSPGVGFYSAIVGAAACERRPTRCDLSHGIVTGAGRTVTFRLARPDPDFLYKLALPFAYVLPAATPARDLGSRAIPATGPYVIASYRRGHELRLTRNPAFHEWSRAAQPDGYPDAILWALGVEPERAVTAIERGRADWMLGLDALPPDRRGEVSTRFVRQLHEQPLLATDFFVLNTKEPPFDDVRVRRALNEAVDRRAIVALYGGSDAAQPTCQILPPLMGGYRRYCPYRYDLGRARRLVAASGTAGTRVLVWDTRQPTIAYEEGLAVVRALRRIGYRAALKIVSASVFQRKVGRASTHAQVVSGGWGADYPTASDFIELKLSCRQFRPNRDFNNNIGFCDPGIDRQVDRAVALQIARPQAASRLWAKIDRELVDRAVWLPTVTPKTSDFVSRRVGNYQFHPLWGVLVDQLWVR